MFSVIGYYVINNNSFVICLKWSESRSVASDSLWPYRLSLTRFLCPWNSPGKNTEVGYHSLLQGSSQPRDQAQVSWRAGRFFTIWATREAGTYTCISFLLDFLWSSAGQESTCSVGELGLIPGLGRSLEKGKATYSSILAWRISMHCIGHGVAKSQTLLSDFH